MSSYTQANSPVNSEVNRLSGTPLTGPSSTPSHLQVSREEFERRMAARRALAGAPAARGSGGPVPPSVPGPQAATAHAEGDSGQDALSLARLDANLARTPDSRFLAGTGRDANSSERLDRAIRDIWRQAAAGNISMEQAGAQVAKLTRTRDEPKINARKAARRERRTKTLNWITGMVPPWLRHLFRGVGVLSVANCILAQIKRTGVCNVFYAAVAAATGTSRKTVQRAIAALRIAGLVVIYGGYNKATGKNAATLIKTTCRKLLAWIARNVGGGGQQSPSSLIIETFFVRPARNRSHKEAPNGNGLPP